eukprot:4338819-Amphidinium_carterae.1
MDTGVAAELASRQQRSADSRHRLALRAEEDSDGVVQLAREAYVCNGIALSNVNAPRPLDPFLSLGGFESCGF